MALGVYTRNNLRDAIADPTIFLNLGSQVVIQNILNRTARMITMETDLKSQKRIAVITPNIFDDIFRYTAPSDLKEYALIDVRPQAYDTRNLNSRVRLVTPEVFDRKKNDRNLLVSVEDDDLVRVFLINIDVKDTRQEISTFDLLDDGASTNWAILGDATNIVLDQNNKVKGSASLRFDLVGSGTTAGIQNSNLDSFSLGTDVFLGGAAFAWIYVNSTANLTNFIFRIGSSSSNYYQITETTDAAGNSFINGWNLVRFDFADQTETGTVNRGLITFSAIYMTKTSGKADDGYRIDDLQLHSGEIYEVVYYSKFPWQSDAQTYLENSTSGTDYINADTDEFELYVLKGKMELFRELRDWDQYRLAKEDLYGVPGNPMRPGLLVQYKRNNPSQRLQFETEYFRF